MLVNVEWIQEETQVVEAGPPHHHQHVLVGEHVRLRKVFPKCDQTLNPEILDTMRL